MSGGEQQMLAIGRALMARPKAADARRAVDGDRPNLVQRIYETIAEINRQGVAILLVEQNANYALELSKRGLRAGDGAGGAVQRLQAAARRSRRPAGLPGDVTE